MTTKNRREFNEFNFVSVIKILFFGGPKISKRRTSIISYKTFIFNLAKNGSLEADIKRNQKELEKRNYSGYEVWDMKYTPVI